VTEAIRSGIRLECSLNDLKKVCNGSRVKLADMTGDGLQDIVMEVRLRSCGQRLTAVPRFDRSCAKL